MQLPDPSGLLEELSNLAVEPLTDFVGTVVGRCVQLNGPFGPVLVGYTDRGINLLRTLDSVNGSPEAFRSAYRIATGRPVLETARVPAGLQRALDDLDGRQLTLDLVGLTAFERDVLAAAGTIPSGQTRPYGWIASEIGRPKAVRAVGSALGRNPVPLLIPCHRVIKADGSLGEYIFGSDTKAALLRAERLSAL